MCRHVRSKHNSPPLICVLDGGLGDQAIEEGKGLWDRTYTIFGPTKRSPTVGIKSGCESDEAVGHFSTAQDIRRVGGVGLLRGWLVGWNLLDEQGLKTLDQEYAASSIDDFTNSGRTHHEKYR